MRSLLLLESLVAAAPLVAGTPFNAGRDSRAFCKVVDEVVTFAHKQSAATAFCSSYLSLSPIDAIAVSVKDTC